MVLFFLFTAADYISWGVGKGAEKAGELIKYGSNKLRAHLQPTENPKPVDPRLQKGIQYARVGSHAAVKVSSYIGKVSEKHKPANTYDPFSGKRGLCA